MFASNRAIADELRHLADRVENDAFGNIGRDTFEKEEFIDEFDKRVGTNIPDEEDEDDEDDDDFAFDEDEE